MISFIFPGQGSQSKGMGETLFDEFLEITTKADAVLGYSIKKLCLEDPDLLLGQTQYTQPALYTVNVLNYLKKVKETGKKPDCVAGHSLGEYCALFAAGAFDFETGLKLVKKRGELMSQATGGGMAAVIGLDEKSIAEVLKQKRLDSIDIANLNSPYQIVLSGRKEDIESAKAIFEATEGVKMVVVLKTSGAFHSRYMEEPKIQFEKFISDFQFSSLTIPVISNVHARMYRSSMIKENLVKQITHPVKWTESIRYLMGMGEMEFEEIGPGKVLAGLVQKIKKEAEPISVADDEIAAFKNFGIEKPVIPEGGLSTSEGKSKKISPEDLGSKEFKEDYNLKYAYLTGGMYRGIASKEMVVKMGKAGFMGFLGTGGMDFQQIKENIEYIKKELSQGQAYGLNFLHNANDPGMEEKVIDLYMECGIKIIEASAFLGVTAALVKYRAKGLFVDKEGRVSTSNRVIAKLSRPEVAEAFLSPAPSLVLNKLLTEKKITQEEAKMLERIPVADDICVEADSGGHTDGGVMFALLPAMLQLRDDMMEKYRYSKKIRVGAAGGIGTPGSAAASFILGADFILTGSINQCTVEASTSDAAKDLLQQMNVQDTEYAPAGDMFEIGAKVQVLKRGLFFSARANKLYDLYRQHNSIDEIEPKIRTQIQEKFFKKSFEDIYKEVKTFYPSHEIERAERSPKHKMALIFRWYFGYSTRLALQGSEENRVDYQIHCGPALGSFNQWVKNTDMEDWKKRHVDEIAVKIMKGAAEFLNQRLIGC